MASSSGSGELLETDTPHQPTTFSFLKREFGKTAVVKRSFQSSWFKKWKWLHYDESKDVVYCFTCMKAKKEGKLNWSANADQAFITHGFYNWKDAVVKYAQHETSKCHKEAVLKVITLPATTRDVAESLSAHHKHEKIKSRQCFLKILSTIRFLGRQGLALRGHGNESDSNFTQLMKLQGEDDPAIEGWLEKKTNKYTSADIQNEILTIMAHRILRGITSLLHKSPFLAIMVDETTDSANKEQVVICMRWVDTDNFEAHEEFIGLYQADSTNASTILSIIRDVLLRLNITITKLRGQCYDGAASMSGHKSGVATEIQKEEPRALYTHCYGHALNLACSDVLKRNKQMQNALDVVQEITKLVKKSPQRDAILQRIKEDLHDASPGIRILCPTRWTVKADGLKSIITNFEALQLLWECSLATVKDQEMRARIYGVKSCMQSFDFLFGVILGELLLRHSDNLSRTLQSPKISAAEGQQIASMTLKTLQTLRNGESFSSLWTKVTTMAERLGVSEPALPRKRRVPRNLEIGTSESFFHDSVEDLYCQVYYEAIDAITSAITSRFDQPGYRMYCHLQSLLLKAANGEEYGCELKFVTEFYGQDFNEDQLKLQLETLSANLSSSVHDLPSIITHFKSFSTAQRSLLSQVCTLLSLILVMPATNAVSERSFSALRRISTFLRTTMTQNRLNSIMVLHVHKEHTDKINLIDVGNDFVGESEHRMTQLGKFIPTDL